MIEKALGILAALAVTGVACELLARYVLRHHTRPAPLFPNARMRLAIDREVLPALDPIVHFDVDCAGIRSHEGRRPSKDAARVLVAGGSAAEGYLLDWTKSWAGVLERELNSEGSLALLKHREVHVGSVGKSRTGALSMRMILEELLPSEGQFDGIVIMVGATDIITWFEQGAPADWTPPTFPRSEVFAKDNREPFRLSPKGSALAECARRLKARFMIRTTDRANAGRTLAVVRKKRANAKEIIREVPEPTSALAGFREHLDSALNLCRRHARQVVVVRQPCFWKSQYKDEERSMFWSYGVGNPYHGEVTRYFDLDVVGRAMEQVNEIAAELSATHGIPCLDLMPYLERSMDTYYDFNHFTPVGAEQVGKLVATVYLGQELPAPRYPLDHKEPRVLA